EHAQFTRPWQVGETILVAYTLRSRLEPHPKQPRRVAVFHGPWLLAVDEAVSPNYFDEPSGENRVTLGADLAVKLVPAAGTIAPKSFIVSIAHFQVPYLPGGYAMQPASAILRPVAEFTAGPDTNRLDFWLTR
ncbi:MAG: hypothetical protein NTY38_31435, partial [Acidobacteria bacterium]|nr:hypothetical protein [Acidobacteriota bacterium]